MNVYLFQPLLKVYGVNNVKRFSKANETIQKLNFIIVTLLHNDPKSNKVVDN